MRAACTTGLLLLSLVSTPSLQAQKMAPPLTGWDAGLLWQDRTRVPHVLSQQGRRSHTGTGLLVGAVIGAAATTVFLIGFCSDADTKCEMDEVGRAVLFIAVPAAALGALIGSLIHTDDEES